MDAQGRIGRRTMLKVGAGLLVGLPALVGAVPQEEIDAEEGVTAPEDLMKEHGVLNRCLLVYEEAVRRLRNKEDISPDVFNQTATLIRTPDNRAQLMAACQSFIRMYRPHESREDTVLFPAIRTLLTPQQVEALGERMEEDEHTVLGDEGFEKSVDAVAAIEKTLGIYDLNQFTPKL